VPVKFRSPGGIVCEIVPQGRYKQPKASKAAKAKRPAPRKPAKKKKK
jgi:hypothetical protein